MIVKFNLNMFGQNIPTIVNVPDDYIEEALDNYEGDEKIAVNELLNDEI